MLLGIESGSDFFRIALKIRGESPHLKEHLSKRTGEEIPQLLLTELRDEFLSDGKTPEEIVLIAGPGSYTGLRIAHAFAEGLAVGWDIPIVAISKEELIQNLPDSVSEASIVLQALTLIEEENHSFRRYTPSRSGEITLHYGAQYKALTLEERSLK